MFKNNQIVLCKIKEIKRISRERIERILKTPLINLMSQIQVIYEEIRIIQRGFRHHKHVKSRDGL